MSFRVIDGDGPGSEERRLQRQQEVAENQFSWAIREAAANLLRIARGAGSSPDLLPQFERVMTTARAFYQIYGRWPVDVIETTIPLQSVDQRYQTGLREGRYTRADIGRWTGDGSTDRLRAKHTIVRGALQLAASELVQQAPQRAAGDRELYEGVDRLELLQRPTHKKVSASNRKKGTRRTPTAADDL